MNSKIQSVKNADRRFRSNSFSNFDQKSKLCNNCPKETTQVLNGKPFTSHHKSQPSIRLKQKPQIVDNAVHFQHSESGNEPPNHFDKKSKSHVEVH